jgi:FAD/FMN-containing dehydrogenase
MPFINALSEIVGPQGLVQDAAALAAHNRDWRGRYQGHASIVVKPANTVEVAAVVRTCAKAGVGIVPQGGNTGLCGGSVPREGHNDIILNLSRMNRIRESNWSNDTLTCEAGVILSHVQEAARVGDRLFPLSIAAEGSAEIGGVISTNAGGTAVLRYGNMRSLVLGLEVVLPDGRIWNGLRSLRKDNSGYDLKHWFIGAEGTLGIITAAVLRLFPLPKVSATAWVGVPNPMAAVALLGLIKSRCGDRLSAFELVARPALQLVLQHIPGSQDPLTNPSSWQVLVELDDSDPTSGLQTLLEETLFDALNEGLVNDAALAKSLPQANSLWALREQIAEAQRLEGVSIKHDISVPVNRIPELIERASTQLEKAYPGVRVICFGHVGDGNLHFNLSKPDRSSNDEFIQETTAVNRLVHDVVMSLGGSISAEHGVGQLKVDELVHYKDPLELELMRSLKQALDPAGLMNPGKIFSGSDPARGQTPRGV